MSTKRDNTFLVRWAALTSPYQPLMPAPICSLDQPFILPDAMKQWEAWARSSGRFSDVSIRAIRSAVLRAPLPEEGYHLVFVLFTGDVPNPTWEVFADGFTGGRSPLRANAAHRPMGLPEGADGSLNFTDDMGADRSGESATGLVRRTPARWRPRRAGDSPWARTNDRAGQRRQRLGPPSHAGRCASAARSMAFCPRRAWGR